MISTRKATLAIGGAANETVHLFDDSELVGMSLLSVGTLCDRGYTAEYGRRHVIIRDKERQKIIYGWRDSRTGLYYI